MRRDFPMAKVKIALARFYNAKFIELKENGDVVWELWVKDIEVVCRLSKETTYSRWGSITLDISDKDGKTNEKEAIKYPSPEKMPTDLIFEVIAYKWIEIDDDLAAKLYRKDLKARETVLKQFERYKNEMEQALNYSAGSLGLRVNAELVCVPIYDVDQRYLFLNKATYAIQTGFGIEIRQTVKIEHSGTGRITLKEEALKLEGKNKLERAAECLAWFLRGWAAEDYVLRFISFFTALEPIVPPPLKSDTEKFRSARKRVSKLVKRHARKEDKALLAFLKDLKASVSLTTRFNRVATEAKLDNWESDIVAFKRFYEIRNNLLHRGDASIASEPLVNNEDLRGLEFIAQKYVRYLLYNKRKSMPLNKSDKTTIWSTANFVLDSEQSGTLLF